MTSVVDKDGRGGRHYETALSETAPTHMSVRKMQENLDSSACFARCQDFEQESEHRSRPHHWEGAGLVGKRQGTHQAEHTDETARG